MRHDKFEKILKRRIELTKSVLSTKNKEYASDSDKLHNFKRAGAMLNCTPERALIGMATKHFISLLDIIDRIERIEQENKQEPLCITLNPIRWLKKKRLEEKIGDSINYLILLEAIIKERYE